jgi:hypothetical protein
MRAPAVERLSRGRISLRKIAHDKWAVFDGKKTAIVTLVDEGASAICTCGEAEPYAMTARGCIHMRAVWMVLTRGNL